MLDTNPDALIVRWEEFFDQYGYRQKIVEAADSYPDVRSVVVEYTDINHFDFELLEYFMDHPGRAVRYAEKAMQEIMPPESKVPMHFRVRRIPKDRKVEIRDLRAKHIGKFLSVEGLVRKATEVRPKILMARFECMRCGAQFEEKQDGPVFHDPLECDKDKGGCGRAATSTRFKLLAEQSVYVDTQKIEIQEKPEGLRGGAQPQRLVAWAEDDIAGLIFPGDRIVLNGTLRNIQKSSGQVKSTLFDIFTDVNQIDVEEHEFEAVEIDDEDANEIMELSKDPSVARRIRYSIAPTIYGMDMEKEALALQLFGGVSKEMPDGTKLRGDIHLLMIGDPGTAKSQLLRYISDLAPRGIYASGKSSSAAGLTAAAVKDDFGEGRWTLEAGTLVIADLGIACIDELDKMTPQDRSAMHEAMEQQTITVSKAGINATLQSRCSILGAANPKLGRFDSYHTIAEQINLPPALMSRFDAIFSVTDEPNEKKDREIAEHIMKVHLYGGAERQAEKGIVEEEIRKEIEDNKTSLEAVQPDLSKEFLRKYVAYARGHIYPTLTKVARNTIRDYYLQIRKQGEAEGASVPITARQLEAFVRLSEASARMHLRNIVTEEDAERAIRIVRYYLEKAVGSGGGLDIDIIATGVSKSQRDKIRTIRNLMEDLANAADNGIIKLDDLLDQADSSGVSKEETRDIVKRLLRDGEIYYVGGPDRNRFRIV